MHPWEQAPPNRLQHLLTTIAATAPNQQQAVLCEIAVAGQKRAHEDAADQALQRLGQSAGVNNVFVAPLQAAVAVALPQSPQKQQLQQQQQAVDA